MKDIICSYEKNGKETIKNILTKYNINAIITITGYSYL